MFIDSLFLTIGRIGVVFLAIFSLCSQSLKRQQYYSTFDLYGSSFYDAKYVHKNSKDVLSRD